MQLWAWRTKSEHWSNFVEEHSPGSRDLGSRPILLLERAESKWFYLLIFLTEEKLRVVFLATLPFWENEK